MHQPHEYRRHASAYAELALNAKSSHDRDRLLRMKRSYELLARSAEYDASLRQLISQLKG